MKSVAPLRWVAFVQFLTCAILLLSRSVSRGHAAEAAVVEPNFSNEMWPGWSSAGAVFLSGSVGDATHPETPNDGSFFLVRASIGSLVSSQTTSLFSQFFDESSAYHHWIFTQFPASALYDPLKAASIWGLLADPDGDGLSNIREYTLGLDPNKVDIADSEISSVIQFPSTGPILRVSSVARSDDPYLQVTPKVSSDLRVWLAPDASVRTTISPTATGFSDIVCELPTSASRRFLRYETSYLPNLPAGQATLEPISPFSGNAVVAGEQVLLQISGTGSTGRFLLVEVYVNGVLIGRAFSGRGAIPWTPTVGTFSVRVRAVDNYGVAVESLYTIEADRDADGDRIPDKVDPRPTIANVAPLAFPPTVTSTANFHSEGALRVSVPAVDADGDAIFYQLSVSGTIVVPSQPAPVLEWAPPLPVAGPISLEIQVKDRWGATSNSTAPSHVFRTPPRPQ